MLKLVPRVGVGSLASPLEVGADRAGPAFAGLADLLEKNGAEVVRAHGPLTSADRAAAAGILFAERRVDAVCLAAASWFEDYLALDLLEECDLPLLLWPLPGMETGALCGAQQLTCCLRQLGKPHLSVFGEIRDPAALQRSMVFLRAAALRRRLRRARIGLAGHRVAGMSEVSASEIALKKTLGPRVVPVDMVGLLDRAASADPAEAGAVWQRIKEAAAAVRVPDEAGLESARMYLAIRETVRKEGLAAFAFGCYPDFMGRACLAASLLADEGIAVACEGDVNGAVGMLMLSLLTGRPVHNTDWLDPVPDPPVRDAGPRDRCAGRKQPHTDGSVVFTHCGSGSWSLAAKGEDITLAPVRLAHQGVCSLFPAATGPVTLVSLIPCAAGYQMAVMQGEAIATDMVFPGNPLRVCFDRPVDQIIDWIHREGIGHHWMAGYGRVAGEVGHLAAMCGTELRYVTS